MEAQAIINEEAQFTVLEMHRYEMDSLLATFAAEGLHLIGGRKYGYQEKRFICLFSKE